MENELSGPSDTPYVEWLGQLATELKTNLPWIMCHGAHANDTIETCNGCDCTDFVPGLVAQNQPAMWSEDEQWFDRFTQGAAVRHTGDVGRGVAKFIAVGGSMHNFYMFHGGTMWGNWSTTVRRTRLTPSYANSANLASRNQETPSYPYREPARGQCWVATSIPVRGGTKQSISDLLVQWLAALVSADVRSSDDVIAF